ncbi:MAG TPA: polysaccharide biosynthesis/export family protein [bacterium]|nr:polysaccharide biosynthesis/export family protein [bacterium]
MGSSVSLFNSCRRLFLIGFLLLHTAAPFLEAEEYRIKPGDEIEIFVWESPEFSRKAVVQLDGTIPYPIVGELIVSGQNSRELEGELKNFLAKYIKAPQVSVLMTRYISRQVTVLGEVRQPGAYSIVKEFSLTDLVAEAGGFTQQAQIRNVSVLRNQDGVRERFDVNMRKILKGKKEDFKLQSGDVVYIPRSAVGSWNWIVTNILPTLTLALSIVTLATL